MNRRPALIALAAGALLGACAAPGTPAGDAAARLPIVFVHGNGDSAALWTTTLWRFESNGWPRERLHAIDMPYPTAREDDTKPQPGRSGSEDQRRHLAAEVERVLAATGAQQVVLIGNSRGGYAIRNYIAQGGAAKVAAAVLGGTPNHGVWAIPSYQPNSEFNGAGRFLTALNAPQGPGGEEVTPGVRWLTIRSDSNDKYAQPDGAAIGAKGMPTGVGFDGPALKGATNLVVAGADHREASFGPQAFAATWQFLTGREPDSTEVRPEARVVLDGRVSGLGVDNDPRTGALPSNRPLVGATVAVYATDPATGERTGDALLRRSVGPDGRWGPLTTTPSTALEFEITAPGYATTHVYRSPFARSSSVVHLQPLLLGAADRAAPAVVTLARPRGYFGLPRDRIALDGRSPPPGVPSGVPTVSSVRVTVAEPGRAVVGEFNGERVVGRAWPVADNHAVILELHR